MRNMLHTYDIKDLTFEVIIVISVIIAIFEVLGNSLYFLDSATIIRTTFLIS